jgi:hypothetical protein
MSSDVRMVAVGTSGIKTKSTIIETGVTLIDGKVIDRNCKLHLNEIDLVVSGAATITIFLGNTSVYERTLTAAGEIHSVDRDIFVAPNDNKILSISVSTNVTVAGRIFFTIEYTGGKVIKETEGR